MNTCSINKLMADGCGQDRAALAVSPKVDGSVAVLKKTMKSGPRIGSLHHVVELLVLVELTLLLGGGVLVLLILRDKVVHIGLSLGELHLVHTLASVPVEEGLAAEHGSELLRDALPHLLDGGGVAKEACGHLEALGGDVANGGLDVVGDPLNEVRGVLVLDVEHLLVNLLGGHAATEHAGSGEVAAVTGVGGAHHVL